MKIKENAYVAIQYTLKLDDGELVDESKPEKPLGFVYASGQIIAGMEKAIAGMEVGQETEFSVEPVDGYGERDEAMLREIPRSEFPDDMEVKPDMTFEASGPNGSIPFRIKSVDGDTVSADFNHPLAGERLNFKVTIAEVREATKEELAEMEHSCCAHGCSCED